MSKLNSHLINLAQQHLEIGFKVLELSSAFKGPIEEYKTCPLKMLQGLLEGLSGVFCELARDQNSEEPTVELYRESNANTLLKVRRYLDACSKLLEKRGRQGKSAVLPFTAMYVKAQTLMNEVIERQEAAAAGR